MRTVLTLDYVALCAVLRISRSIEALLNEFGAAELIQKPEGVGLVLWKHADAEPRVLNRVNVYHSSISVHVTDLLHVELTLLGYLAPEEILAEFVPVVHAEQL